MKTKLGIYVHIPFCVSKCRYCDFNSGPALATVRAEYVTRLLNEIDYVSDKYSDAEVVSVYFGGGTPSVLELEQIESLMKALREHFSINKDAEITIEINPGTVDSSKLDGYIGCGINRLSIGLQSADNKELRLLGRIHTREDFLRTYEMARMSGFKNINIDLISALPGQQADTYEASLEFAAGLKPEHISSYSFQLEEGTWFWEHRQEFDWPSEELDRTLYDLTQKILNRAGYFRYEISNYSIPGFESRHNSIYWTRGDYLGLGLGASSFVNNIRFRNPDKLSEYMEEFKYRDIEELSVKERMEEFMFLGLRMIKGVCPDAFREEFGTDIYSVYGTVLEKLKKDKLLRTDGNIRLTERGIDVSNYVFTHFLMD